MLRYDPSDARPAHLRVADAESVLSDLSSKLSESEDEDEATGWQETVPWDSSSEESDSSSDNESSSEEEIRWVRAAVRAPAGVDRAADGPLVAVSDSAGSSGESDSAESCEGVGMAPPRFEADTAGSGRRGSAAPDPSVREPSLGDSEEELSAPFEGLPDRSNCSTGAGSSWMLGNDPLRLSLGNEYRQNEDGSVSKHARWTAPGSRASRKSRSTRPWRRKMMEKSDRG